MTGVSECSQQRGNLKDNGYIAVSLHRDIKTLKYSWAGDILREHLLFKFGDRFNSHLLMEWQLCERLI
ncbi:MULTISPECIES: hypothetical protein [Photorhabdus]|uniref:hypothetical protein n=1 Tax=Photorhabdus TaxID=29487 RepID=UPI0011C3B4D2|nr:hypothetical protein [Photorhabdus asymbiotica]